MYTMVTSPARYSRKPFLNPPMKNPDAPLVFALDVTQTYAATLPAWPLANPMGFKSKR